MPSPLALAAAAILALTLSMPASAADPAPKPAPAAADPPPVVHSTKECVNTGWLEAVHAYAKEKGLACTEQGTGPVRFLLIGGANPGDLKHPLELAQKALAELEAATGMQETFISKNPEPGEIYWLAVYASGDQVGGFIDFCRQHGFFGQPEGEDLMKKVLSFSSPLRVSTAPLDKIKPIIDEWSVYATACLAIDAFYRARDPKGVPPPWIREGFAADLQRELCKRILCTTIAYEDKQFPMSDDWRGDVARLMRSNDRQNKPASELMRMPIDALPNVYYQQMWSLCSFMRELCGQPKKGARAKFREILEATATGASSETALKAAFGKVDPALTTAWRQWAQASK